MGIDWISGDGVFRTKLHSIKEERVSELRYCHAREWRSIFNKQEGEFHQKMFLNYRDLY